MSRIDALVRRPLSYALCVLVALCAVFSPVISHAVALHDLEHHGGHSHHSGSDQPQDHFGGPAGDAAAASDDESGESGALHELAHSGHCCAPGGALPAHASATAADRESSVMPADASRISVPKAPARLFRPPIAA